MAKPQQAPLPQELLIGPNWEIVFDSIDPVSGAHVAGVKVSGANVTATNALTGQNETLKVGPYMLVPGPNA